MRFLPSARTGFFTAALLASTFVASAIAVPTPSRAKTFGLVIGINDYQNLSPLEGAVNDALDVAAALKDLGADVHLLLDRQAHRRAIFNAWGDILAKARPGDTVVFSYAGHGGQEPERRPGSEEDGLDEVFLLSGFHERRPGNRERIIDDEIHQLFAAAGQLKIIFIADTCHSGTMTRRFDRRARALGSRLASYGAIEDDGLPPPDPAAAEIESEDLENVVFFGAVQDGELALEYLIEGKARGALSWSFARALRGQADSDSDHLISTRELERYLVENVRGVSEGRQLPQMMPRGRPVEIALQVPSNTSGASIAQGELTLRIFAGEYGGVPGQGLKDVRIVEEGAADLIWDWPRGEIVSSTGDIVARLGAEAGVAEVQPVIDKWLLLRGLHDAAERRPLSLRLFPDDGLHRRGATLKVRLQETDHGRLTLFNLATDGTVQFLAPWPQSSNSLFHGRLPKGRPFEFPLVARSPFGADHLVALTSPSGLKRLEAELLRLDGRKAASELRKSLSSLLAGEVYRMGRIGLFTAP